MFDSGLGGLSVLREIRALLPRENVIYYADGAHCPYGDRSSEYIRARSIRITDYLLERGSKLIVVACNTATSVALEDLRAQYEVPIIGMVPAVKPAAKITLSGKIAVLATPRTVVGKSLARLVRDHAEMAQVYAVAAHGLVELVEAGRTSGPEVDECLLKLLSPVILSGVDTIVLGCSHYPFLRASIEELVGEEVSIIDSGEAIARRTKSVLKSGKMLIGSRKAGRLELITSGDPERTSVVASQLLEAQVEAAHVPL